ncbi:MAG: hypothetical protein C0483_03220 [Pirellula sp.]|nr:hypothetical protein [Pirellula sp.]
MPTSETTLEADGVRIVFFRDSDRIAHRVEVRDDATSDWATAFTSLEGRADEAWPPSPPFQQLHVEQRPTGPIVFLIGMAGKSHWSAAVEAAADRRSIRFDVAVRFQARPKHLGSAYAIVESFRGGRPRLVADSPATLDAIREPAGAPQICPTADFPNPPATLGWKYAVFNGIERP